MALPGQQTGRPGRAGRPGTMVAVSNTLRIATYNIKFDDPARTRTSWAHRRDLVLDRIAGLEADVIGLQEVLAPQLADIAAALGEFAVVGVGRDDGQAGGEHVPLLLRRSRVRSTASGTFWLSRHPGIPSTMFGGIPRICSWARLHDLESESAGSLGVFNVHLDHRASWRRVLQLQVALRAQRALDTDASVLVGDFNAPLRGLAAPLALGSAVGSRLLDARGEVQRGSAPGGINTATVATFTGWNREIAAGAGSQARSEAQRIDHVLLGPGLRARNYRVVTEQGERLASDHLPVVVDVEISSPRQA